MHVSIAILHFALENEAHFSRNSCNIHNFQHEHDGDFKLSPLYWQHREASVIGGLIPQRTSYMEIICFQGGGGGGGGVKKLLNNQSRF